MADETKKDLGKWECNTCGDTAGVINGICPNCGPTQTTAVDEVAKKESGFYEAEAEKAAKAEAEAKVAEGPLVED